jgi:hypothetical protein
MCEENLLTLGLHIFIAPITHLYARLSDLISTIVESIQGYIHQQDGELIWPESNYV